ncbi:hypothetical protein TRSC58_07284 [Trypanosoma rangeli SC58]|uniref:Uncharacterized protein n=1 Tax=Trypanosoma rangeli SC58 TaxID=429131 RepID=A0A061IRQ5_TRYRA|nr:hypothetical protein TRSC58_07284 [Trypanosoma rangeli SC58]
MESRAWRRGTQRWGVWRGVGEGGGGTCNVTLPAFFFFVFLCCSLPGADDNHDNNHTSAPLHLPTWFLPWNSFLMVKQQILQ